jgi:hypothetical protein
MTLDEAEKILDVHWKSRHRVHDVGDIRGAKAGFIFPAGVLAQP